MEVSWCGMQLLSKQPSAGYQAPPQGHQPQHQQYNPQQQQYPPQQQQQQDSANQVPPKPCSSNFVSGNHISRDGLQVRGDNTGFAFLQVLKENGNVQCTRLLRAGLWRYTRPDIEGHLQQAQQVTGLLKLGSTHEAIPDAMSILFACSDWHLSG